MKTSIAMTTLLIAATMVSAQTITFEDLTVPPAGYYNGSTGPGGMTQFTSGGASFNNNFSTTSGWSGWSYSRIVNVTTAGFGNQYAAYNLPTGTGDGSQTYAVAFYDSFTPVLPTIRLPVNTKPQSMRITNSTYAALSMLNGDGFAKKFGGPTGNDPDFFVMTIRGYDALNNLTGAFDFYLADYRFTNNSQDYVLSQWTTVPLTALGNASKITFTLDSSDHFIDNSQNPPVDFGMNTPAYFALDNLVIAPIPEPGSFALMGLLSIGFATRRIRRLKVDEPRRDRRADTTGIGR